MTLVTEETPIRAAAIITTYVDVMRAIAHVEAAEGFESYPVLKCSAAKDRRIFTDTLGISPKRHVTGYLTYLRSELEAQRRQLYETITGAFHIPPGELRRIVRDRLDIETDIKDGGFKSWAGAKVRDDAMAAQAEDVIFSEAPRAMSPDGDGAADARSGLPQAAGLGFRECSDADDQSAEASASARPKAPANVSERNSAEGLEGKTL